MNKIYVLNNLLDESLFLKDHNNDTRTISESKQFTNRRLAENFLKRSKLTEKYSVKLALNKKINESVNSDSLKKELESVLDDTKDMIDTSLDYIEEYYRVNEEVFDGTNIEDVLDRLRKLKKGASGICFRPSFYDSDGSGMISDLGKAEDPKTSASDGEGGTKE